MPRQLDCACLDSAVIPNSTFALLMQTAGVMLTKEGDATAAPAWLLNLTTHCATMSQQAGLQSTQYSAWQHNLCYMQQTGTMCCIPFIHWVSELLQKAKIWLQLSDDVNQRSLLLLLLLLLCKYAFAACYLTLASLIILCCSPQCSSECLECCFNYVVAVLAC